MKKVLVIGGGKWQVPIVKKVKELGFECICSNLYENSEAFSFADYSYVANVLDKETNLEIAIKHQVDAVITDQTDIAVNTVAYINEKLNLLGIKIDDAKAFTNKLLMRKNISVKGLSHPNYEVCKSVEDVVAFFKEQNKPIIIKPLNNQSSRGVNYISSLDTIPNLVKDTLANSNEEIFLAEEYIQGIELTAEGYKFKNTNHCTLGVSKKTHYNNIIGVAQSLQYQKTFEEFDIDELKRINDEIFKNLPFCITHVEYKYFNKKFYLVEAAIRGGGTRISSDIVPIHSGYDINKFLIYDLLDIKFKKEKSCSTSDFVILKFLDFKEGKVKQINHKCNKNPNIIDWELEFKKGHQIQSPNDDRSRLGYFILKSDSLEKLNKDIENFENSIDIVYE